jgi:hypothetical protein
MFAVVALAVGFAFLGRAGDPSRTAARPKANARVVVESSAVVSADDEARIAAFQQSAAISHLTPAAFPASADAPQKAGSTFRLADQPPRKPPQRPAPKSVVVATPVPQLRPATPPVITADLPPGPKVIMADLPPAPPVTPAPAESKPGLLGTITQDVERTPGAVQDFARAATDRVLGGLADVRARVGL